MNISYTWLKKYINIDVTPEELAKILTSIGLETGKVMEIETVKGGLEGLVVGEVLTCTAHENSDHLSVTTVNIGENEPLQIVCGAPNVAAGQKVIVATIGAKLYSGEKGAKINALMAGCARNLKKMMEKLKEKILQIILQLLFHKNLSYQVT